MRTAAQRPKLSRECGYCGRVCQSRNDCRSLDGHPRLRGRVPPMFADSLRPPMAGWNWALRSIRNKHFLHSDYFTVLSKHNVAHVYNPWAGMPPVDEQMAMLGSPTNPRLCGARFVLRPGRMVPLRLYSLLHAHAVEPRAVRVALVRVKVVMLVPKAATRFVAIGTKR